MSNYSISCTVNVVSQRILERSIDTHQILVSIRMFTVVLGPFKEFVLDHPIMCGWDRIVERAVDYADLFQ